MNVKLFYFYLFLFFLFNSFQISSAEDIDICYYNPDAAIKSITDAIASVQPFINYLNKTVSIKKGEKFVWHHFSKASEFENYVQYNKVEFAILNSFYFLDKRKRLKLEPFLVPIRNNEIYYYKVIVVRKNSPFHTLKELKGKRLSMTAGGIENYPFLNALLFKNQYHIEKDFQIKIVDKSSNALFALLMDKADGALVTKAAFDIVKELSPKAEKKLKIIFTSQKINLTPFTYFKGNVRPELLKKFIEVCKGMSSNPKGAQSLLVFKVSGWKEGSMEDFQEMNSFLKNLNK